MGLAVEHTVGDVERMPFADASFDVASSAYRRNGEVAHEREYLLVLGTRRG